jgi:hypothetical protein
MIVVCFLSILKGKERNWGPRILLTGLLKVVSIMSMIADCVNWEFFKFLNVEQ